MLIETYQRGHWTASALPAKELDAAELAQLPITMDGVKCPKTGACVALGSIGGLGKPVHDIAIRLANGVWSFSEGPTVSSGAPYTPINGPGVMDCPAVGYCIFASGDRLMSFSRRELDDLCSGRTYVTIGRLAVAVLSGEGVLCAAGGTTQGTNYVGLLASGKLKVAPGPGRQLLRGGGGCGMHGEGHVHSGWCVWFYGPSRDVVRRGMDCERAPYDRLTTRTADGPGRLCVAGDDLVPKPQVPFLIVGDYGRVVGKSTLSYAFSEQEEG